MSKSDDAKRARLMTDVLLNYDPQSEAEPGHADPEAALNSTLSPYAYHPAEDNPHHVPWPGSPEEMEQRAPRQPGTRARLLAQLLMRGQ